MEREEKHTQVGARRLPIRNVQATDTPVAEEVEPPPCASPWRERYQVPITPGIRLLVLGFIALELDLLVQLPETLLDGHFRQRWGEKGPGGSGWEPAALIILCNLYHIASYQIESIMVM